MSRTADITELIEWTGDKKRPQDLGLDRTTTPEAIRVHVAESTDDLNTLIRLTTDPHPNVRFAAYRNPTLPTDVLNFLVTRGDKALWGQTIHHPNLGLPSLLNMLSAGADSDIAFAALDRMPSKNKVIENPIEDDGWPEVCDLVTHKYPELSDRVAENLASYVDDINELVVHPLRNVRLIVANHPDASRETLTNYLDSPDADVVFAAAMHPLWSEADIDAFIDDLRLEVRLAAAQHPKATAEALTRLIERDQPDSVRAAVAGNPRTSPDILVTLSPTYQVEVGGNPSTPQEALARMVGLGGPDVHRAIAGNPSCPVGMLTLLAGSPDPDTRSRVADNPSAPREIKTWAMSRP